MAWNEHTNFRQSGFRALTAFRVFRNLGAAVFFKPWFFALGGEAWEGGFGIYLGPICIGFGPTNPTRQQEQPHD